MRVIGPPRHVIARHSSSEICGPACTSSTRFGDDAYAAEELVAELGAAVIGAELGISHATRDDHAAYLAHWVRILRQEPRHLWTVAGAAETAAEYLLELGARR